MILHFLRHAHAEALDSRIHKADCDRLLTPDGRDLMQRAAKGFLKVGVHFEMILSSPYPRAVETAKMIAEAFHFEKEIRLSENLIPEALYHKFRKEILDLKPSCNSILIVTHQPFVSESISFLLTGKDVPIAVDMGTGTLCTLEIDSALKGPAILSSMLKAEQAAFMSGDC